MDMWLIHWLDIVVKGPIITISQINASCIIIGLWMIPVWFENYTGQLHQPEEYDLRSRKNHENTVIGDKANNSTYSTVTILYVRHLPAYGHPSGIGFFKCGVPPNRPIWITYSNKSAILGVLYGLSNHHSDAWYLLPSLHPCSPWWKDIHGRPRP